MVKLSGWVFLIIGAVVSVYSTYVQSKIDSPGLTLFFWVGIAMIGIGVFKLALAFVFGNKSKKDVTSNNLNDKIANSLGFGKDLPKMDAEKLQRERDLILNRTKSIIICPNCSTKHYSNSNFCHMCGTRLK
ncbi:hypothetical protein COV13_03960 [Candidatus Woesearchaeota archaeon CG10_big_fil_rev_8_21_14_0_10_32_9]|nr:MAG: hypothetical protein COV13_03960 [Candidatus Woesearchaeota archaeon CG10_big_fil_rev_8_21_14_0_10_32_9]